jgi:hypothetical protein
MRPVPPVGDTLAQEGRYIWYNNFFQSDLHLSEKVPGNRKYPEPEDSRGYPVFL